MFNQDKFGLLRKILKMLGLKDEAIDDIIGRIAELLFANEEEKAPMAPRFPYRLRDDFLSPAEQSFYLVLCQAVETRAAVCPKVNLADLFYVSSKDYGEFRAYTNKIDRKHVDFILCAPGSMRPLVGIELDDRSHRRTDRQERDEFVDNVFAAAGLPLVRIPVQRGYSLAELRSLLQAYLPAGEGQNAPSQPSDAAPTAVEAPVCPRCGSAMVLRTSRSGPNKGQHFWGCSNYPRCRGIVKVPV